MERPRIQARCALAVSLAIGIATAPAQSATLSYLLDQSNVLADGTAYLQVDVSDGTDGAIDFTVRVLGALGDRAAGNFGIQSFAFNVVAGGSAEARNVTGLADGWRASDGKRMDGFGLFDIRLQGQGNARLETLSFSISGIDGDRPEDYTIFSTGKAAEGHQFFAAQVAGFLGRECPPCGSAPSQALAALRQRPGPTAQSAGGKGGTGDIGPGTHRPWHHAWQHDWREGIDGRWDDRWAKDHITSGYFGGSTAAVVPLPGAAWMFLTGAAAVATHARRQERR